MKAFKEKYESQGFDMTPEMARMAQEQADRMIAAKKKEKAALKAARDAKLKSIGIDGSAEFYVEKLAEVKKIVESVEQLVVKQAEEMLFQKLMLQKLLQSLQLWLRHQKLQPRKLRL